MKSIKIDGREFEIEAFFVDLDGTLFDKLSKKPSKKNIEAIKNIQKDIPVIISTGRSFSPKVKKTMDILNVNYAICQNGAIVANKNGQILQNITLNTQQINEVIEIVKKNNLGFTINSNFLIYTNSKFWFLFKFLWSKRWKKIEKFHVKDNFVNKIVVAGFLSKKKIWKLANEIQNSIKHISVKTSGKDKIIEITHEDATKGHGAIFVSELLKIDVKNTIHIGDSENDSTTLSTVGALVAMKDASTKLLDVATHIGPKHKRAGVSKLLNEVEKPKEIKR